MNDQETVEETVENKETDNQKQPLALLAEVSDLVTKSSEVVRQRLVDAIVEREQAARVELLDSAVQKWQQLTNELKKLKPDSVTYNEDGTVQASAWSKDKLNEKNKANEKIRKLEKAIELALANDYSKLKEFK